MELHHNKNSLYRRVAFHGLSIQQRLPLLVCILLCSVILTFGFASYYGVRKASLEMGEKRLRVLTDQLATMFAESSNNLNNQVIAVTNHDTVRKCIQSGGTELRNEALIILNKLRRDSTWLLVELLDSNRNTILQSGDQKVKSRLSTETIFSSISVKPDSCKVGQAYAKDGSMYYPLLAVIADKKRVIAYLLIWRSLSSSPKGLSQLSQLLGTGARLYIANRDGSLWTNLVKPVAQPPIDIARLHDFFKYKNEQGDRVVAAIKPVAMTQWLVLVEFSEKNILETATSFLQWIISIGGLLIACGIFITWLMSRSIIKPLNQLTAAATAIAEGDYSTPVAVGRMDELGKLAHAFNEMTAQIKVTQMHLETKVKERTSQLETANQEMESFSYSVSHDLRAPLRGITGLTEILEDEFGNKLGEEAKRLTGRIRSRSIKMGQLIDDLLAFSKVGRDEINKSSFNSEQMVAQIIAEQDTGSNINWKIHPLPDTRGDVNAMRQVWVNLISNAIKYSQHKENPSIEIDGKRNGGQIVFSIQDNGVGFEQQYADKLFKVFQRLHNEKEFEGTGVGLAIVEKIIAKHGGSIWVEAEIGKGAKFFFTIPAG